MEKVYGNQREAALVGYLAGILDGEGTFGITKMKPCRAYKNPRYQARVTIGMCDRRILDLFVSRYGGSILEERVKIPNRRPVFRYAKVGSNGIIPIIEDVLPFLIEKKERAELIIEFLKLARKGKRHQENGDFLPITEEELAKREELYLKMKELNAKRAPATTNRENT